MTFVTREEREREREKKSQSSKNFSMHIPSGIFLEILIHLDKYISIYFDDIVNVNYETSFHLFINPYSHHHDQVNAN